MFKEDKQQPAPSRRVFLGCAAGALGIGAAPTREEPEEVIPLKTIVTTSGQEGLLEVPWGRILKEDDLKRFVDPTKTGPANLFLVVGRDFDTVMEATGGAFFGSPRVDRPVLRPGDEWNEEDRLWAFVHFGAAQSTPAEWTVTRVAVQRERVRVTVTRPDPKNLLRVNDRRVYMIWAPFGERKEKAFTLEAYDETNRAMMMTRRVVVAKS